MVTDRVYKFLEKHNIKTDNPSLYILAFTHSSFNSENKTKHKDYERLEFLGDSILNMLVSEYLYKKYPKYGEGKLTKLRANYVCQAALIEYSHELGLKDYLKVSVDEMKLTDNEVLSITSDIFESFLGALFLDQGFAFTKRFIAKIIFRHIDDEKVYFNDYKSKIKEYCDSREIKINYGLLEEYGVPHDKTFIMAIYLDENEMGHGKGRNKKEAEQSAAKAAMRNLDLIW